MKYKFEVGDIVDWCPSPGWRVTGKVVKQTHVFWVFPAYHVNICKTQLSDWSKFGPNWFILESQLRCGSD